LRVVLGLGNVGQRYEETRHNVGFRVVERLAERARARWQDFPGPERLAYGAEVELSGQPVALVKPRTLMNRSGRAAAAALSRYACPVPELLVVFDDADLALGRVRVRQGGGAGGHNGLRSLMDVLRAAEFGRVKLGVKGEGREESDLADYVLRSFDPGERAIVEPMLDLGVEAVDAVLEVGLAAAMNLFNGRSAAPA
jgi:PTH1 family peptidyl-tRNA hydrolase